MRYGFPMWCYDVQQRGEFSRKVVRVSWSTSFTVFFDGRPGPWDDATRYQQVLSTDLMSTFLPTAGAGGAPGAALDVYAMFVFLDCYRPTNVTGTAVCVRRRFQSTSCTFRGAVTVLSQERGDCGDERWARLFRHLR